MSKLGNFVTSVRDFISMLAKGSLTFFSCRITLIKILSVIVYGLPLQLNPCSWGSDVFIGIEIQDVKPQV